MDLLEIIRSAIERLSSGAHSSGLRSVMRHIDAAAGHLARGQEAGDEAAFTDAIYRTNQAFEGSIKEAFRVLAGKDPARLSPATIESYLEKNHVLRERVLIQLKRYRQEWRNPSTHDYNLDFDEDEAFLAIVSVAAFAKVLVDQIAQKLAFDSAAHEAEQTAAMRGGAKPVSVEQQLITAAGAVFGRRAASAGKREIATETQAVGALAGYITATFGSLVQIEPQVKGHGAPLWPDLLITSDDQKWIVEVKRNRGLQAVRSSGASQALAVMAAAGVRQGILLLFEPGATQFSTQEYYRSEVGRLAIVAPD